MSGIHWLASRFYNKWQVHITDRPYNVTVKPKLRHSYEVIFYKQTKYF